MTDTTKPLPMYASEKEAELIRATFKNNEYLFKVIRNLLLGFDVNDADKALVKSTFSNPLVKLAFRKKVFPLLEDTTEMPTGMYCDFFIDMEKDILGAPESMIEQRVKSKERVFNMLGMAMDLLDNPDGPKIDLSYGSNMTVSLVTDPLQIGLLARSLYIRTIGTGLGMIKIIADQEQKTPEQAKAIQKQDSSK